MRYFQVTFERRKRLFISAFSVCKAVPLILYQLKTEKTDDLFFCNMI